MVERERWTLESGKTLDRLKKLCTLSGASTLMLLSLKKALGPTVDLTNEKEKNMRT